MKTYVEKLRLWGKSEVNGEMRVQYHREFTKTVD